MRPSWGKNIISIANEEKDLGVVIQDNLSPEKHINRIFGDTFMMLRNIRMAFHFLDKYLMRKIITTMIRPKLEYAEVIWSPHKKKHVLKLGRIQRIATKMVPELENLTYEARLKEIHWTTLKERRERGDLITIYKLMNNLEDTDRKDQILRRKGEAKNLRGHKKILHKGVCLRYKKVQFSLKKHRYLEWTEGRGDNGKECTSTEGKIRQI